MSQTRRDWNNSRRVRTHERNSDWIGHNNTKHFLCPIRSWHPLEFLEISRWESEPRGSFTRTWKLSSRPFSRPDWLSLGLQGWITVKPAKLWALEILIIVLQPITAKIRTSELITKPQANYNYIQCSGFQFSFSHLISRNTITFLQKYFWCSLFSWFDCNIQIRECNKCLGSLEIHIY